MASSKSKKRGISALIADSSNVPEVTSKRACAVSAGEPRFLGKGSGD